MGINKTGALFKGFIFDGEDSCDYGIYITGEAVFNAPERDVEMVSIPGRNGSLALDRGRFNNITVSYPAGFFGATEADFAEAASNLRNMLASRSGYCRLEDDYNPDEYRLALYKSGLEISPADLKSGTCTISFECQPQRFLKSGEDAVELEDGDTITNPTLFDSRPMLQVWGDGTLEINGTEITIDDVDIGQISLPLTGGSSANFPLYDVEVGEGLDTETTVQGALDLTSAMDALRGVLFSAGDHIQISLSTIKTFNWTLYKTDPSDSVSAPLFGQKYGVINEASAASWSGGVGSPRGAFTLDRVNMLIPIDDGTPDTLTGEITYYVEVGSTYCAITLHVSIAYDGAGLFTFLITASSNKTLPSFTGIGETTPVIGGSITDAVAFSTISALGNPLYIDLDIGEAYQIKSGEIISSNAGVYLPAMLPTLVPGANEIALSNTITRFEIVPRWFIV